MSIQPVRSDPFAYINTLKGATTSSASGQDRQSQSSSPGVATRKEMLQELKEKLKQSHLELRLHPVPHTNVIILRFYDPATGKIVREFPSERLAEALAEVRSKIFDRLTGSGTIGTG